MSNVLGPSPPLQASNANDVARRVKEGWNIIRSTVPAITAGRALLGEK